EVVIDTITQIVDVLDTITIENTVNVYDTTFVTETVTVYDTILTSVTDTLIIDITSGVNGGSVINTLLVYPNPANDQITIDYGNFALMNGYQLVIINELGQEMHNTLVVQQTDVIDISNWAAGLYYVRVTNPNGMLVQNRKIVLQ
ncbi:MAG: T9SS type A sorting domain-containing protein, partial [Flavobacteriales bacterium]